MTFAGQPPRRTPARPIYTEQVRLLYVQAPLSALASFLISPLLAFVLWPALSHHAVVAWLIALEVTVIIRLGLIVAFQRDPHPDQTAVQWAERYIWACAASGICWGSCIFLLALSPSLVYQVLIALFLGGMLMEGALTMTPVLTAYIFYALPLALPTLLWLLLQADFIQSVMGSAGILYLLLALGTCYRFHQTLARSLMLVNDNQRLAQSFATAKEHAEKTNQQLAEQQAALQDSVDALREFYRVISTPRRHLNEQIQAVLAMGHRHFNLAIGVLARIENQHYEVVQAIAPDSEIVRGDVFALSDAYCQETLRIQAPCSFERIAAEGWWRTHLKLRLETYLGTPVEVAGETYGTLSFADFQPHFKPYSTVDHELIQLMARWVGTILEQERMATAAQRQHTLLAHASRLNILGEMASSLAHEINQPITAIALYTETCLARLQSNSLNPAEIRAALEKIATQSARTNTIIQHIRRFARQGIPQYLTVRIKDLLDDIDDFLHLEIRRHQVQLKKAIPPELPLVMADPLQVQQVILNLIHNAVDAMSANEGSRTITIFAKLDREAVEIGVKDNGPGVAPDVFDQLLHPFFTTKPDGLGLGLSISQSIVEAHCGRLWATPNHGPGVTFHFTLPLANRATMPDLARTDFSLEAATG
jgi:C4-dicarboxylate-specific signal transduction histidine kinase